MRWGISSWTYAWTVGVPGYPAPASPFAAMDLLRRAHELGAQVLQIADNLPLERLTPGELDALALQAADWHIALEAGTRGVTPRRMLPFLGIAKRLNARLVRTLLHGDDGCPTLAQAEANLRALLPALRGMDLVLAVENHDFFPAQDLRALIDRIDDPRVGVCLDPVNNLAQGESTRDVLEALDARTLNFHCKDYTIRRKPGNLGFDVEGCPAGEGLLDVPRCMARLPQAGDLSCILELWTPWQGDLGATCALEDDWARRSASYLSAL